MQHVVQRGPLRLVLRARLPTHQRRNQRVTSRVRRYKRQDDIDDIELPPTPRGACASHHEMEDADVVDATRPRSAFATASAASTWRCDTAGRLQKRGTARSNCSRRAAELHPPPPHRQVRLVTTTNLHLLGPGPVPGSTPALRPRPHLCFRRSRKPTTGTAAHIAAVPALRCYDEAPSRANVQSWRETIGATAAETSSRGRGPVASTRSSRHRMLDSTIAAADQRIRERGDHPDSAVPLLVNSPVRTTRTSSASSDGSWATPGYDSVTSPTEPYHAASAATNS